MAQNSGKRLGDPSAVRSLLALVTGARESAPRLRATRPTTALDFEFLLRTGAIEVPQERPVIVAVPKVA